MPSAKLISGIATSTLVLAGLVTACDSSRSTQPLEAAHSHALTTSTPTSVVYNSDLADAVKEVTARYNSQVQATKNGYAIASPCVASPAGGMGFHWVNNDLVDPVFEPLKPEAVLYAPDSKGKMRLVAVEYLVINVGQPAPTFGGQPFDVGGSPIPVPHWSLHVWLYESNPSGLFNPWNPNVVCPGGGPET